MVTTSEDMKFKGIKQSSIFLMLELGTWPQIMQTMTKCKVDTYPNMHKQKLGSNSQRASRTEPGK